MKTRKTTATAPSRRTFSHQGVIPVILTIEQLKDITRSGGGLVVDASTMTFSQIKDLSAAATIGGAGITIRNLSGLTALQLGELATLAPGLIVFDLTQ
jgi:hypothetical protein